ILATICLLTSPKKIIWPPIGSSLAPLSRKKLRRHPQPPLRSEESTRFIARLETARPRCLIRVEDLETSTIMLTSSGNWAAEFFLARLIAARRSSRIRKAGTTTKKVETKDAQG